MSGRIHYQTVERIQKATEIAAFSLGANLALEHRYLLWRLVIGIQKTHVEDTVVTITPVSIVLTTTGVRTAVTILHVRVFVLVWVAVSVPPHNLPS